MGAEFLAKKALLYMCYKICARTSNFYVCVVAQTELNLELSASSASFTSSSVRLLFRSKNIVRLEQSSNYRRYHLQVCEIESCFF